MSDTNTTLRKAIKQQRKSLTPSQRQMAGFLASLQFPKLLPLLPKQAKIGIYLDSFGELPTDFLLKFCRRHGFLAYAPITQPDQALRFAPVTYPTHKTAVKPHRYGMTEPTTRPTLQGHHLHAIICPLVAVDQSGYRLGMGGGFYDRTFAISPNTLKIGLGYDFQAHQTFEIMDWDMPLDYFISDKNFYRF